MVPLRQTKGLPNLKIRNIFISYLLLIKVQNNFTEMFMMSSDRSAQLNKMATRAKNRNIFKWKAKTSFHMCQDSGELSRALV